MGAIRRCAGRVRCVFIQRQEPLDLKIASVGEHGRNSNFGLGKDNFCINHSDSKLTIKHILHWLVSHESHLFGQSLCTVQSDCTGFNTGNGQKQPSGARWVPNRVTVLGCCIVFRPWIPILTVLQNVLSKFCRLFDKLIDDGSFLFLTLGTTKGYLECNNLCSTMSECVPMVLNFKDLVQTFNTFELNQNVKDFCQKSSNCSNHFKCLMPTFKVFSGCVKTTLEQEISEALCRRHIEDNHVQFPFPEFYAVQLFRSQFNPTTRPAQHNKKGGHTQELISPKVNRQVGGCAYRVTQLTLFIPSLEVSEKERKKKNLPSPQVNKVRT